MTAAATTAAGPAAAAVAAAFVPPPTRSPSQHPEGACGAAEAQIKEATASGSCGVGACVEPVLITQQTEQERP